MAVYTIENVGTVKHFITVSVAKTKPHVWIIVVDFKLVMCESAYPLPPG